jgi:hypothetical protein
MMFERRFFSRCDIAKYSYSIIIDQNGALRIGSCTSGQTPDSNCITLKHLTDNCIFETCLYWIFIGEINLATVLVPALVIIKLTGFDI